MKQMSLMKYHYFLRQMGMVTLRSALGTLNLYLYVETITVDISVLEPFSALLMDDGAMDVVVKDWIKS